MAAPVGAEIKPAPFDAICRNVEAHSYINFSGQEAKWKTDEKFWNTDEKFVGSPWKFRYRGDDYVLIDDTKVPIVARVDDVIIIAAEAGGSSIGASMWSYAINLSLGAIAASYVQAHADPFGVGISIGAVQFDCNFGSELF